MALTKPAGSWTYDDLFSLSDDGKRYEIIEGELYEMPPPNAFRAVTLINLLFFQIKMTLESPQIDLHVFQALVSIVSLLAE